MKYVYLISILFSLTLTSCSDGSVGRFEIVNNTSDKIDSICIAPDRKLGHNYISLKAKEVSFYKTDMSGKGTDGAFMLRYKANNIKKSIIFGYYSNGAFLERLIKIEIQPDTVLFKYEYSSY